MTNGEDRDFYFTNNRTPEIRVLKQSDMLKCPFAIMAMEHYRDDGTCKCNDAEHRAMMIREWEYTEQDFIDAGIVKP